MEVLVGTETWKNTWDWTAVNTLVKFTTVNINAVHIKRKDNNKRKDQGVASHIALVKFTTVNVNAIHV